jgi:hypothetical protein
MAQVKIPWLPLVAGAVESQMLVPRAGQPSSPTTEITAKAGDQTNLSIAFPYGNRCADDPATYWPQSPATLLSALDSQPKKFARCVDRAVSRSTR